ncbi:hypothetical protein V6N13_104882 [Hibiscus sabdariffa]|uniref:Uncharacterized protein n=1 Tax=Hibiscus sabdariffa TaxID=183260 RepID=A0ABR2SJ14_9ROSI
MAARNRRLVVGAKPRDEEKSTSAGGAQHERWELNDGVRKPKQLWIHFLRTTAKSRTVVAQTWSRGREKHSDDGHAHHG